MAKQFNPAALSPADRLAWDAWQQKVKQFIKPTSIGPALNVGENGELSAPVSYAIQHPEYLKQHPELQEAYNIITGAELPPSVKAAVNQQLGDKVHPTWAGEGGFAKNKGIWSQPETWIQLALGGAVGGAAAAGAFSGAGAAAGGATSAAPAAGGTITTASGTVLPAATLPSAAGGVGPGMADVMGVGGGGVTTGSKVLDVLNKYGRLAGLAGGAVSGATKAAANNRYLDNQLALQGYEANTSAQDAFQKEMDALAILEAQQRKTGLSNLYKQSVVQNPGRSPYSTGQLPGVSDAYKTAVENLANQASSQLAKAPKYDATNIPTPTYAPPAPPKGPSALENIGNWAGPILTGVGAYNQYKNMPQFPANTQYVLYNPYTNGQTTGQ